jgi:glycosyltransferase involved in cell wall biosynthesis
MRAVAAPEPFSLLLPVYAGDDGGFVERAFRSATTEQVRPPAEVVIVRDGPVPDAVATTLAAIVDGSPIPVTLVELPRNLGLARALQAGLAACRHDIVARMDADDVSLPERFERQVPLLEEGVDVVGCALAEMGTDERTVLGVRSLPLTQSEILRSARFHTPFHHPTVVFRRAAVERVGGYQDLPALEDYWLWVRLLARGARGANLAEPLLLYRVDAGAFERRGGWRLAKAEVELQRRMRRIGFTTRWQFVRNVVVRGGWRLVPVSLRRPLYRLVFRRTPATPAARVGAPPTR